MLAIKKIGIFFFLLAITALRSITPIQDVAGLAFALPQSHLSDNKTKLAVDQVSLFAQSEEEQEHSDVNTDFDADFSPGLFIFTLRYCVSLSQIPVLPISQHIGLPIPLYLLFHSLRIPEIPVM
jgi:hypothetical protein